jgi:hypothetical protein
MLLALFFVFTESTHMCNLILAHMCFMHSDLSLNLGVIVLYGKSALCVVHRVGLVFLQAPVLIHGKFVSFLEGVGRLSVEEGRALCVAWTVCGKWSDCLLGSWSLWSSWSLLRTVRP